MLVAVCWTECPNKQTRVSVQKRGMKNHYNVKKEFQTGKKIHYSQAFGNIFHFDSE